MDPNNMNATGMPSRPSAPSQPAAPTFNEAPANPSPLCAPAKKSGKGTLYGMIIFAVLAVLGIGFSVYLMMDSNTLKTNYETQISNLKKQNSDLLNRIAELEGYSGDEEEVDQTNYLTVEEWGLKVEIGSDIKLLSMNLSSNEDFDAVYIKAISSGLVETITSMDTSITGNIPGNFLARSKNSTIDPFSTGVKISPVYNDGEYNYFVYQPTGYVLEGLEQYAEQITDTYNVVYSFLNNQNNYSKA
jgi:hypothetical protein